MTEQRALIVGAGISGLSAAIALRNVGVPCLVVEQAQHASKIQIGGGLHLWTNAVRALQRLGLEQQIEAIGAPLERTEFRTWRGPLLAQWPVGEVARELGVTDVGVNRQDLHALLMEAAGADVVRLGAVCTGFEQDADGVRLLLADGAEERGSVLIAADGLRSIVRQKLHGDGKPRFAGYTQWQSLVDDPGGLLPAGVERVLFGPGSRAVLHPVGGERLFWAAVLYGAEDGPAARAGKDLLVERFAGWQEPLAQTIASTPDGRIARLQIYDRKPIAHWGQGRVTLAGDAAHPMTTNLSQGACQALEDAVVLSACLSEHEDPVSGLREYERRRIQRTSPLVRRSRRLAQVGALRHRPGLVWRDGMMRLTMGGPAFRDHRRFVSEPL